jgi:GMP synthase-like glutamine amidotransferase
MKTTKVAIIDNSLYPEIYRPVAHWSAYLKDVPWEAFQAPEGCLPNLKDFTHIILTGSEATILEREAWVEREVGFVKDAVAAGNSILGSCYGHQLLALALAGPAHIGRCREPEIGWIPVDIHADSALLGPKGEAYTFSVHFDEVKDLTDSFVVMASTSLCPIQAFQVRARNVWGIQIHPEISVKEARELLRKFGGVFPNIRPLYEKALGTPPRDSRLILKIIKGFLAL